MRGVEDVFDVVNRQLEHAAEAHDTERVESTYQKVISIGRIGRADLSMDGFEIGDEIRQRLRQCLADGHHAQMFMLIAFQQREDIAQLLSNVETNAVRTTELEEGAVVNDR